MKKLIAILLVLIMMISLVACGGDEEKTDAPEGEAPKTEAPAAATTYAVGEFDVLVPGGWRAVPLDDMWSDDENAKDPNSIDIYKGATSDYDIFGKAYMRIDYYAPETDMVVPSADLYENVVELDPIVAGDITWNGFSCTSFEKKLIILWTGEAGEAQYQASLWCEQSDGSFAVTDADVLEILSSVKPA